MARKTGKRAITNKKRTIALHGGKTSVSLEDEFWRGLQQLALSQNLALNTLVTQIDRERTNPNLSSAIRVYVLQDLKGG